MTHHASTSVVAAIGLVAFMAAQVASGAIYLKADATGTADGSSWANAYTDLATAIAAVNEKGDAELRVAGGYYVVSTHQAISAANFHILGGYRGASDGDEVRDIDAYQTIFSPVAFQSAKKLQHVHPRTDGKVGYTNSAERAISYTNGRLAFPEDRAGDYDCYTFNQSLWCWAYNTKKAIFTVTEGAGGEIGGVIFLYADRDVQVEVASGSNQVLFEDCGFYCGYPQGTQVKSSGNSIFRRCKFRFCTPPFGGGLFSASGTCVIEDCEFSDNYITHYWGHMMTAISGANVVMRRCTFTRNCIESQTSASEGGLASVSGALSVTGSTLEDCVFTNNHVNVTSDANISLVEAKKARFKGCVWANNRMRVAPTLGLSYAFVQATYTAYDNSLDGCLFSGNVIAASAAPTSAFSAGMAASGFDGARLTVVNSAFVDNAFEVEPADGIDIALSRGVLTRATAQANSASALGVANCTFAGEAVEGVRDIIQLGASHSKALNVINCVFQTDGVEPVNPFRFDVPACVTVADCAIKNMQTVYLPTDVDVTAGLTTDEIPLAEAEVRGAAAPCRPAAKTPGIRMTSDLAVTAAGIPATYQYKRQGEDVWSALTPAVSSAVTAEPQTTTDLLGVTRTFGTLTRGAVQELTEAAETGVTLTVRADPLTAGTFSRPSTQATSVGGAIEPVTAVSLGSGNFTGWYRENGTLYSDANPLAIPSLDADLVLTAHFAMQKVEIRFDLDGKGVFDVCGEDVTNVYASVGEVFPEIPSFTVAEGYVYVPGVLPATVPDVTETIVIKPEIITKDVRFVYVTPEGAGSKDGSNWENACSDVAAAVADAGKYRGEVRLWGGRYVIRGAIPIKSNVSVFGGFGGQPTVLSGDVNGDDKWQSVLNGATVTQGNVWDVESGVLNRPNPSGEHDYWKASVNIAENAQVGFQAADDLVTNVVFSGLTMTGFGGSAIYSEGSFADLTVSNCSFVACGGASAKNALGVSYHALHAPCVGNVTVLDDRFIGDTCCAYLPVAVDGATCTVSRCTLVGNNTTGLSLPASHASVTRVEQVNIVSNGIGSMVLLQATGTAPRQYVLDSAFVRNKFRNGGASITVTSSGKQENTVVTQIRGCRFEGNVLWMSNVQEDATTGIEFTRYCNTHQQALVADCSWVGNELHATSSSKRVTATIAIDQNTYVFLYVVDCAFEDNLIDVAYSGDSANSSRCGIIQVSTAYDTTTFYNCLFTGNSISGGNGSDGEIIRGSSAGDGTTCNFTFNNCIIGDYAEPHRVFSFAPFAKTLTINDGVVEGLDSDLVDVGAGTLVTNRVSVAKPALTKDITAPDGRVARAVSARADRALRREGRPIALASGGMPYIYTKGAAKPWASATGNTYNEKDAAARGISLDSLKPDMFGGRRVKGKFACGPLNAEPGGLLLLVR